MDVLNYVNNQSQKAAAFLDAYARTSPAVQQAAEWYRDADQSGLLTVFKIVYTAHDLTNQFVDMGQHFVQAEFDPSSLDGFNFPDVADELTFDPGLSVPVDQIKDGAELVAEDAEKSVLAAVRARTTEQEQLRKQQDADLQDPAKLAREKQEGAELEAQWEANRKDDEQAQQSRQQEAEQKATDSLIEAVSKDQGQKKEDQQQDPEASKLQGEQEKARADQTSQMTEYRDQLAKKYEGSPEQEKHLEEFDKAAKAADEALARQQATELQRSIPPDPSHDL
ncbi:MAG TPA: hypothetical protein VG142_08835 [Trebonia sp.]|nr:hypothetical protein [Trebonia sp.]